MHATAQPAGHSAFTLQFDEPQLAGHVERWARQLEVRALSGERWGEGQLIYLDGWPARLVATTAGLELHEQDLTLSSDQVPRYLAGVTGIARWSAAQWQLARAVSSPFQPLPDESMGLQVCPRFTSTGRFILARSASLSDSFSGWVLQCGHRCRREAAADHSHVDADGWRSISVFEFMKARPGLVKYLALADGFLVDAFTGEPQLGRRHPDSSLPASTNLAMLDLPASSLWQHFESVDAPLETQTRLPVLDFERDADVWRALLDSERQAIVRERYGVNDDLAAHAIAEALSPARLKERVEWSFRDELPPEQLKAAIDVLESGLPDQRRVAHAAAMKLRALTGRPFAPLMELTERLEARLDDARRGRC